MAKKNLNNYVAILCGKRLTKTKDVIAVRFIEHDNKTAVYYSCEKLYPSYKVKAIHKMYDEDFTE